MTTIEEVLEMNPHEERNEAVIFDKHNYFRMYTKEQYNDHNILNGNRLRLNKPGTQLFLSGLKGTLSFDLTEDKTNPLELAEEFSQNSRGVMLYPGNIGGNMILQTPNSNNLRLMDKKFNDLQQIEGNFKPGTEYGEFDHFISSLCDTHILVSKGLGSISIIDTNSHQEIGEIKEFFTFEGQITRPFAAVSNKNFTKILGASLTDDNLYCLHYMELSAPLNGDFTVLDQKNEQVKTFIPIDPEIKALEVSKSGEFVFLGAFNSQHRKTEILVAKFDNSLEIVANYDVGYEKHAKPRRIKRIQGYNIIVIGLRKNLVILDYSERTGRFTLLKELEKVCRSDIVDFEFRDGVLYVKGYQEDYISIIDFNVKPEEFRLSEKT